MASKHDPLLPPLDRDVTAPKGAEEALRWERDSISTVLDTAGALVVVLDRHGHIVHFNRACERTTGYSFAEVRGRALWDLFLVPEEVEPVRAVFEQLRAGQSSNEYENYWLTKNGEPRLIAWSNTVLLSADGAAEYVIGTGIDVTERRQAEESPRIARDQLELRVADRTTELRKANELLAALHETTLAVVSRLDISDLLTAVVERAVDLVGAAYGFVYLVEPGTDQIKAKVGTGLYSKYVGLHLKRGEGLAGKVWKLRRTLAVEDYASWSGRSAHFEGDPVGPVVGLPLTSGTEVVGVLGVARFIPSPPFRQDETDTISRFAHLASIALDNARLYSSVQQQLAELQLAQQALEQRLTLERLVTRISTEFVNLGPSDIDAGIQHALQAIGQFAGVDRSYVFQFSGDGTRLDNTHEWCAPGIKSFIHSLRGMPRAAFPWFLEGLERLENVAVPRVADMPPEASAERSECQREGIQSILLVPLAYRGVLVGFLGFDSVQAERCWGEDIIALLQIVAGIITNALEHRRALAIQAGQRQFLELLATGGDFSETLHSLVRLIEDQWPGMLGLVLLLDEDGKHLHIGASVSLPQDYVQSIEGLEIGPMVGSCGTACYRRERVIVEDTATDPRWDGLRDLALQYGLRACWSEPVFAADGQVVGTFAMYYRQPRAPTEAELRTIEMGAHLVGVAIEHARAERAVEEAYQTLERRVSQRTRELSTLLDVSTNLVSNLELEPLLGSILEELKNVVDYEGCMVFAVEGDQLVPLAHRGPTPQEKALSLRFGINNPLDRLVLGGREPVLVADTHGDSSTAYAYRQSVEELQESLYSHIRSWLGVPLIVKGEVIGELVLDHSQPDSFTPAHASLAMAFANQAAVAIENARLYEAEQERRAEAERRRRVAEGMREVLRVLNSRQSLQETLDFIASLTCQLLGCGAAAIWRLQDNLLRIQAASGLDAVYVTDMTLRRGIGGAGRALAERQPIIIPNLEDEVLSGPSGGPFERLLRDYRTVLSVPLIVQDKDYGALTFYYAQHREFTEEDLDLGKSVTHQVALAIENARLREQAEQAAVMQERGRLARELHDSVTQSLYSVTMYTEAAARLVASGKDGAPEYLRDARDTAQEALREMRLLIYQLRPPALEKGGLADALQLRLDAVERRGGVHAELVIEGEDQLPLAIQAELHQIAQEALNNALKHAHAKAVRVHLHFGDAVTRLEVRDDGAGFDLSTTQAGGGLGLATMRERAQKLGGRLEIESSPGQGTKILVEVPTGGGG